jgi:hypothetical protein
MNKSNLLIFTLFVLFIGMAAKMPSTDGTKTHLNAKCVAIHPFELKDGVDETAFKTFLINEILPMYKAVQGQEARLIKGDRGLRTGKYALMITFDDVAKRNEIFPPEGGMSEELQKATSGRDEAWAKLSEFVQGNMWDAHTDYFVVELTE